MSINYKKMMKKLAQEKGYGDLWEGIDPEKDSPATPNDTWEDSGVSQNMEDFSEFSDPADPKFVEAFDYYVELMKQGVDYFEIINSLVSSFGEAIATKVLEHAAENNTLPDFNTPETERKLLSKKLSQEVSTFFAVSDGKEVKVLDEHSYNNYWSDLFEGGFDVIGKYFSSSPLATQPDWKPSLDDPNWEWIQEEKEDNWVLI